MRNNYEDIFLKIMASVGLFSAVAVTVALKLNKTDWSLSLIAASLAAMWATLIIFGYNSQRHFTYVNRYLSGQLNDVEKKNILLDCLRGGTINSNIDCVFWENYATLLLTEDKRDVRVKIQDVNYAIEHRVVRVQPSHAYTLMQILLARVIASRSEYVATATQKELQEAEFSLQAAEFLFDLPLKFPRNIKRIFYVDDAAFFQALPERRRVRLAGQLKKGVKLKYILNKVPVTALNFGVYGSIAVGQLDEHGMNVVKFDKRAVQDAKDQFDLVFRAAVDLSVNDLILSYETLDEAIDSLSS